MDINRQPDKTTPTWGETRWNGCFNPDAGVGLFLHAGRFRRNLDWWWAQTAIYLPESRMAVERSWVCKPDDIGVRTPTLDLRVAERGWSASFDGIAQLTTTEQLCTAPRGSGAPSVPVRFEVSGDGSRPWWNMYEQLTGTQDFAGDMHVEQAGSSTGTLTVGDQTYSLDGVAYHDHSSGTRDWSTFGSHHYAMLVLPELTIHEICVYNNDGQPRPAIGAWIADSGVVALEQAEMPRLEDLLGNPRRFEMILQPAGGEVQAFEVEVLNAFPNTITENNDNINGIDWEAQGDPLFLVECQVRVTTPDGRVGYGHIERSKRRSELR